VVRSTLGLAYALCGRLAQAAEALDQTLAMPVVLDHSLTLASAGEAHFLVGQPEKATERAERALALSRDRGEHGVEAYGLRLLGEIAARPDPPDVSTAEGHYRQAWPSPPDSACVPSSPTATSALPGSTGARASPSRPVST